MLCYNIITRKFILIWPHSVIKDTLMTPREIGQNDRVVLVKAKWRIGGGYGGADMQSNISGE